MSVRTKKHVGSVISREKRDVGFAVFISLLTLLLIATPIVLVLVNPFGWKIGVTDGYTGYVPEEGGDTPSGDTTPSGTKSFIVNPNIIDSSSQILDMGGHYVYTQDFDMGSDSFTIGISSTSEYCNLGAVSDPQYLFQVDDDVDNYTMYVGIRPNVAGKYNITGLDVYSSSTEKLTKTNEQTSEGSLTYIFEDRSGVTTIHHVVFTYELLE